MAPASALGGPGLQRQLSVCRLTVELGPGHWAPPCPTNPGLTQSKHPVQRAHRMGPLGGPQACSGASGGRPDLWFTAGPDLAYPPHPVLDGWGSLGVTGAGWAVATARTWQEAWSLERRPHWHPGPAHLGGTRAGHEQCRAGVRPAAAALTLCQAPLSAPDKLLRHSRPLRKAPSPLPFSRGEHGGREVTRLLSEGPGLNQLVCEGPDS